MKFKVIVASVKDIQTIPEVVSEIERSSREDGAAIALRTYDYLREKILQKKAIIAYCDGKWAGFCYLETWSNQEYISHSGLVVKKEFRKFGLAKTLKEKVFEYSRKSFPSAKIFGLTTSPAVKQINTKLGYKQADYSELTQDKAFWKGCEGCPNFKTLKQNKGKTCHCTGFIFDPIKQNKNNFIYEYEQSCIGV